MKLSWPLWALSVMLLCGCAGPKPAAFTGAPGEVRLICLDPGHFHAALVQKYTNQLIDSTVRVYAPEGPELESYLTLVESFNSRSENPTAWREKVYRGSGYLEKMLAQRAGNVVLLAGNNARKIDYLENSLTAGLNVLADKPLVIDAAGFARLEKALQSAQDKGVLLWDIMTERYDIRNILQRELMRDTTLFGTLVPGSPERPGVEAMSVHSFYKEVAGVPLRRPAWYYDVTRQGEGIVDVTTHLIDQVAWKCFPEQRIDYRKDVEVLSATHYPTALSLADFSKSTGFTQFPDFLQGALKDSVLEVMANGTIRYSLFGVHAAIEVAWVFETPPGAGDIARTVIRGTKAELLVLQDKEQGYKPTLYVQPTEGTSPAEFRSAWARAFVRLANELPGLTAVDEGTRVRIEIPAEYDSGHEAHFASVFRRYTDYLREGMPAWERDALLAKYYITTQAQKIASASR